MKKTIFALLVPDVSQLYNNGSGLAYSNFYRSPNQKKYECNQCGS